MGWHTIRKYLDAPGAWARTAAAHAERAEWAPSSSGSGQSFTLSENTSPAPTKATVLVTFSPLTESAENGAFPDSADAQPPRHECTACGAAMDEDEMDAVQPVSAPLRQPGIASEHSHTGTRPEVA